MNERWILVPLFGLVACSANDGADRAAVRGDDTARPAVVDPEEPGEGLEGDPGDGSSPPPGAACPNAQRGWRPMASAPLSGAFRDAVWSGSEMLTLVETKLCSSSICTFTKVPLAYHPASDTWRTLPPIPTTGEHLVGFSTFGGGQWILWGDLADYDGRNPKLRGWSFDVTTGVWSEIPPSPLGYREIRSGVYAPTTNELVLWGGATRDESFAGTDYGDGAAFNVGTRTWRIIPRGPFDGNSAITLWSAEKMLVLFPGSAKDSEGFFPRAFAATFDPATDGWRELPAPPFQRRLTRFVHAIGPAGAYGAVYRGDRAAEDGDGPDLKDGGYWDATASRWVVIPPVPFDGFNTLRRDGMASWSGLGRLFVWGGGTHDFVDGDFQFVWRRDGAVFDPLTGNWTYIPEGGPIARQGAIAVWTGCDAIVYGGNISGEPYFANDGMMYRP